MTARGQRGTGTGSPPTEAPICPTALRSPQEKKYQQNSQQLPDLEVLPSLFPVGCSPPFLLFPLLLQRSFFHLLHTLCSTTSLDLQVFGESSPQDLCSFPEPRWELPLPRVSVARGGALMPRFSHIIRHNFLMILLNQLPNKAGGIPRLLRSYVMGLWNCNRHRLFQINAAGVDLQKFYFSSNSEALSSGISCLRRFQQPPNLGLFKVDWGGW